MPSLEEGQGGIPEIKGARTSLGLAHHWCLVATLLGPVTADGRPSWTHPNVVFCSQYRVWSLPVATATAMATMMVHLLENDDPQS